MNPRARRFLLWPLFVVCGASCEAPREGTPNAPADAVRESGEVRPASGHPGPPPGGESSLPEGAAPASERDLPAGWETAPPATFEAIIGEVRAGGSAFTWSPPARSALIEALGRDDRSAVHAAVLFAHAHDSSSSEALLARLEGRHFAADEQARRRLDAADVVAAAALDTLPVTADQLGRLAALAVGSEPHPDLEVRVEIARSALHRGRDEVVPFLVRVLRALTPAELEDPPDWERITTLAWAKSRAAEALAARAGESGSRFRPDASWEDQMREADRLEGLLAR